MNTAELAILLVILQAVIASPSLVAFINGILGRRKVLSEAGKDEASSVSVMVDTATKLANDLGKRLTDTNILVAALEAKVDSLESQRDELQAQVTERDSHIEKLEAKVDTLIKLYGRDPFDGKKSLEK